MYYEIFSVTQSILFSNARDFHRHLQRLGFYFYLIKFDKLTSLLSIVFAEEPLLRTRVNKMRK